MSDKKKATMWTRQGAITEIVSPVPKDIGDVVPVSIQVEGLMYKADFERLMILFERHVRLDFIIQEAEPSDS